MQINSICQPQSIFNALVKFKWDGTMAAYFNAENIKCHLSGELLMKLDSGRLSKYEKDIRRSFIIPENMQDNKYCGMSYRKMLISIQY